MFGQAAKARAAAAPTPRTFSRQGRELMTPDEVRMLDNRYAIVLLRG